MTTSRNTGTIDRTIRALIGVACLVIGVAAPIPDVLSFLSYVLAAVMLATAATGVCPLYRVFGLSTRGTARGEQAT